MKTNRTTRIMVLAALLAIITAGAPLWAQYWPAWEGKTNADKKAWDEMGEWYKSAATLNDRALQNMVEQAAGFRRDQKAGVRFWKKNKAAYQKALAAAQQAAEEARLVKEKADAEKAAREQAAAEARRKAEEEKAAAAKKAEEERLAAIDAANAKGVTAEDFDYDITRDGKGILIKSYKGKATIVKIPAVIEGMPVLELKAIFYNNTAITSVTLPDSVTTLPAGDGRYSIDDRSSREYYESNSEALFEGCTSLSAVTLSRNLKAIPNRTFYGCTALISVTIHAGVSTIGDAAFRQCTALSSVTLPAGVTSIGAQAFWDCRVLTEVTLPDSLTKISAGAFKDSGLTSIVLPKNLKILEGTLPEETYNYWPYQDAGVFEDCRNLKTVTIESSGLELIRAFAFCYALTTLTINGNIAFVDGYSYEEVGVFQGCGNLTTVNIGPRVTKIGNVDMLLNTGKLSIQSKAALARLR